eukprot:4459560-Pyramimonas_sp.AAC.1
MLRLQTLGSPPKRVPERVVTLAARHAVRTHDAPHACPAGPREPPKPIPTRLQGSSSELHGIL